MEKRLKITTPEQYNILISFMGKQPGLAKNHLPSSDARMQAANLWTEITAELNENGPTIRDVNGWKKVTKKFIIKANIYSALNFEVWSDYKYLVKSKLVQNKEKRSATGGGPCKLATFNSLEETVIKILSLNDAVDGIPRSRDFGGPANTDIADVQRHHEEEIEDFNQDIAENLATV